MGISNPALVAGVYKGMKPLLEGLETRGGIATAAALPVLKGAQATYPLAKAAFLGIQGVFAGLMAKATYDAAKQTPKVFKDPNATLQDKVENVTSVVANGGLALLSGVHLAMDALPAKARGKLVSDIQGKSPEEAAQVLRQTASQQKDLKSVVALHDAADKFEGITKEGMEGLEPDKSDEPVKPAAQAPANIQPLKDGQYLITDAEGKPVELADSAKEARDIMEGLGEPEDTSMEKELQEGRVPEEVSEELARGVEGAPIDLSAPKGSLGTARPLSVHYGIVDPRMARAFEWIRGIGSGAKNIWREARSLPEFGKFRQILNEFGSESQLRSMALAKDVRDVFDAVPDKLTRRAMYRAIEAGFDKGQLEEWAKGSTWGPAKAAYEAALKLTPEQIEYAKKIKAWFEAQHPKAVEAGLLDPKQKRENYVPLVVDKAFGQGGSSTWSGKLKGDFSHAIARDFENAFEVENAKDAEGNNLGLRLKTDDLPEVMGLYGAELDKVDLTRKALKALESKKALAADGEPLVAPVHGFITKESPDANSVISNPSAKISESGVRYETLDHPAFKRFYFAGTDSDGKPVMFKGEMGLHPEIYQHLKNILGKSAIQNWMDSPGGAAAHLAKVSLKTVQESQKFIKANMFAGSIFHATHIATRAAGNLVAPWELERVTPDDPDVIQSTRLGLQLGSDNAAMHAVKEGLGGEKEYNILAKVPGIGKVVTAIQDATFHDIIPAYKLATWKSLYAKNLKLFAKEISSGAATKDQVGYLTSQQVNARFGELNYTDLGSNPTFRHILSLTTLAPDFWRSNIQNFKQVGVGLIGSKAGRQPAQAFVVTAGVTWLAARILNKALSDDDSYHFEDPFRVHVGNRAYSFRTEVQDVQEIATHTNRYLLGRLSPFASSVLEYLAASNWRGEKVDAMDVLKETAGKAIPASLKWVPGISELDQLATGNKATTSYVEQFMTSQGIKVNRISPLYDAYEIVDQYKKQTGHEEKGGVFPVSKYQQLRYALEDGNTAKAKDELAKLEESGKSFEELSRGFKASVLHPWTGSHASDEVFKKSLAPEDRAKIEKAEAYRQKIWKDFKSLHSD